MSQEVVKGRTTVASDYTITLLDHYIGVTNTSSPRTITMPLASSALNGARYIIKDQSGGAGINNITIQGSGGDLIDGAGTQILNVNYGAVELICTGTAWHII